MKQTEPAPLRKYLRRKEAAGYIGVAEQTLACWASRGRGPRVTRIGRMCVYDISELDAFAEGRQAPTPAAVA